MTQLTSHTSISTQSYPHFLVVTTRTPPCVPRTTVLTTHTLNTRLNTETPAMCACPNISLRTPSPGSGRALAAEPLVRPSRCCLRGASVSGLLRALQTAPPSTGSMIQDSIVQRWVNSFHPSTTHLAPPDLGSEHVSPRTRWDGPRLLPRPACIFDYIQRRYPAGLRRPALLLAVQCRRSLAGRPMLSCLWRTALPPW